MWESPGVVPQWRGGRGRRLARDRRGGGGAFFDILSGLVLAGGAVVDQRGMVGRRGTRSVAPCLQRLRVDGAGLSPVKPGAVKAESGMHNE